MVLIVLNTNKVQTSTVLIQARGGEGALTPNYCAPHGQDQTRE